LLPVRFVVLDVALLIGALVALNVFLNAFVLLSRASAARSRTWSSEVGASGTADSSLSAPAPAPAAAAPSASGCDGGAGAADSDAGVV
jgi:hypothetical protein